ncbi:MAG: RHS repeat-associated core domain-containing protein, partial [Candidatus Berkelbacteria bacterium]|nr:RHS repeat-associated core domain-containing protein [Candidatus Berkelbacteria bacterium]
TDALGSPIAVTDAAKVAIESSEYEPFGQLVNKPLFDGPGYTGHVQDAATGLTYMQQRYYDAGIGRFLSVDPVTAYSNPVGAFNRYWYANDNPYKFTDPDGRSGVAFVGGLATESWNAINGRGFDGDMVLGALKDGYDGEGDGLAAAVFRDSTTLIPTGAIAATALKLARFVSQASRTTNLARANKINHIFSNPRHNLGGVAKALGGESKAFKAIEKATVKAVDSSKSGRFETTVKVGGEKVTVRGNVEDGKAKIGTAFVKLETNR